MTTTVAVHREPVWEPLGLLLGLPWYCPIVPEVLENGDVEWVFTWDSPVVGLEPKELRLRPKSNVSFESLAMETEWYIGSIPFLICACCALAEADRCKSCMYAVGFHACQRNGETKLWRKGTLHHGFLDFQRIIYNLHRRGVPTTALQEKAEEFVANGDLTT